MKRNVLLTTGVVLTLGIGWAEPTIAKACPYTWSYRYVYNAYTRRMESKMVQEIDHAACLRQRQAEYNQRNNQRSRQTSTGGNSSANSSASSSATVVVKVVTQGDRLRLRSGPGTDYAVVGSVANGSQLALTGRYQGNWVETTSGRWAHGGYLSQF